MIIATTVLKNNNKILLIKKPTNRYSMPGGKTDFLELPIKGARREFFEETGLKLKSSTLKVISSIKNDDTLYEMYTFYSEEFSGKLKTVCHEGVLEWVDIDKLHTLEMYASDYEIIDYCLNQYELINLEFEY